MKNKFIYLVGVILTFTLVGCSKYISKAPKEEARTREVKIIVPQGLPALSLAKSISENPKIADKVEIKYEIEATSDSLVTRVMKEEADIAIVPSNLAAQLYNKGLNYKIAGTVGWGSLYLAATDDTTMESIKGKEIYSFGKALTPDIIFRAILKNKNINAEKEITINYLGSAQELAPTVLGGKAKIAVLPEPALSTIMMKNKDLKIIMDLNEEWKKNKNNNFGYPQSTLIIKNDLIRENKDFVQAYLSRVKEDIQWLKNNKEKAGEYSESTEINIKKDIAVKAIDKGNLNFIPISETKEVYKDYFKELLNFEEKTIGGKVPDEGIFMEK